MFFECTMLFLCLPATAAAYFELGQAGVEAVSVVMFASAARADGSIVLAGTTSGEWDGELAGILDFAAVALDEDGVELWRWQVSL